jgi:hypothetical protein
MRRQHGQALVELIAATPIVLAVGLAILQLLAAGYAAVLAGGAAEAGALAVARGAHAGTAVRAALPGWSSARTDVSSSGGAVRVTLRPPSLLPLAGDRLRVTRHAFVEAP